MANQNAIAVHTAFGAYTRGQVITDTATIASIMASESARFVHRLSLPSTTPATAPEAPTVAEAIAKGVAAAEAALHPTITA